MATIPSISLIPSGYKAGKVYSVLPTDGSGDLTFARASTATRINKNNLIENVGNNVPRLDYEDGSCPSLLLEPSSTNLITQSESFGNSYWTKSGATIEGDASTAGTEKVTNGNFSSDTDWTKVGSNSTISSGVCTIIGNVNADGYYQAVTHTIGSMYVLTFDINSTDSTGTNFSAKTGDGLETSYTTIGTKTLYYTASGAYENIRFLGDNNSTTIIDNVSVKEVSGFSAPSIDSPLGAFKLVEDTSVAANHRIDSQNLSVVASGSITISVILKYDGSREWVKVRDFATNAYVFFNLLDNSIGNTNLVNASQKIVDLGNDFKRVSFTYSSTLTNAQVRIYLADSGTSDGYTGDGTSGIYIFGAQLEQKSYATSYIPTKGSQISRLSETASQTVPDGIINSSEGVFYAEIENKFPNTTTRGWNLQSSLNNGSDLIAIRFNTSQSIIFYLRANGVTTINQSIVNSYSGFIKIAFKYKSGDSSLWINGVEVSSSATTFSFSNPLSILGNNDGLGGVGYFGLKDSRVFNTALTDSELVKLTTI